MFSLPFNIFSPLTGEALFRKGQFIHAQNIANIVALAAYSGQ